MTKYTICLKNYLYALELGEFKTIEQAIDQANISYGSDWLELYGGGEGANNE